MKSIRTACCFVIGSVLLASCSSPSYGPGEAAKRGDIVDHYGNFTNLERLDTFLENVQKQNKDRVRVTQYTIEGDPIFHNLTYDGTDIKYKFDNSQDAFGRTEIRTSTCKGIDKADNSTVYGSRKIEMVEYSLVDCSGANSELAEAFRVAVPQDRTKKGSE
ncbi:DUF4362 domain-containing protein [Paenibacillus sp. S150]|uniref:DUF4362 domain-containing protein n=1 Tax=Paenibacillus sp. S150 TaxID=2749826 RepID=UPI001C55A056|nr:DUF4362 domain-containing protein [Paenibacillus sp. S150]MBW4081514.1 DUF4362 domain-containing protein [Paenibacillus sp. S150]